MHLDRDIAYEALVKQFAKEYDGHTRMQYKDEDGDLISIRSQADLEEAFVFFESAPASARIYLSHPRTSSSWSTDPLAAAQGLCAA